MSSVSETYAPAQGPTDWLKGIFGTLVDTGASLVTTKMQADSASKVITTQAEQARAAALAAAANAQAQASAADSSGQKWLMIGGGVLLAGVAAVVLIRSLRK